MDFSFTAEQDQFRSSVQRFLAETSPAAEVRRLMDTDAGFDETTWRRLSEELGIAAIGIEERWGGAGFGVEELSIIADEGGRSLLCAPWFATTVLAASAISHGGRDADRERWLPAIASGQCRATLAWTEPGGRLDLSAIACQASSEDDNARLTGTKRYIVDGHSADLLIVAARAPGSSGADGITLYAVNGTGAGVHRQLRNTLDATRKLADIDFRDAPAVPIGDPGTGAATLDAVLNIAATVLSNESVGVAQALFDETLEYTQSRMQFGRAIASFQAIKHRCADLLVELELARSAACRAAESVAAQTPDAPAHASLAKAGTADAAMNIAIAAIQLHGGIGFTWEQDTHLWFRRASSSGQLLGDPAWHRERMLRNWVE